MKKTSKILAVLLSLALLISLLPITAKATVSTDITFDAEFYLSKYEDLQAAFGNDYGAAYNHFLTYGIKEGRQASLVFDVAYYLESYEDLQAAFGTDYEAAYNHFLTYGIKEGRQASYEFDVAYYLESYEDLQAAFGTDYEAAYNHFLTYGIYEGRNTSAEFSVTCYVNGYEDLKAAYGTYWELGFKHYYIYGENEGRHTTHSIVESEAVAATCTESGYTSGSSCEYCGEIFAVSEEVEATGHSMTKVEAKVATCTEDGNIEYYTCANEDGVYYADEDGTTTLSAEDIVVEASHTWDEEIILVEPTCTTTGTKQYTCTVCNETITEEIEATGHDMELVPEVAATCTEAGTKAYYVCANEEGVYYADEEGTTTYSEEDLVIEATGHNIVEVADEDRTTTAATCTESGYDEYYCTYCGTIYLTEVDALDHTWGDEYISTTATCTSPGVETYQCIRCDETTTVEVEASHTVEDWTEVAATCTTEGYKVGICTVCGEAQTETIEMIDHTWNSGEVTVEPTCTETGIMTYTCEVCGKESLAIISAKDHTMTKVEAKDATCTEDGNIEYYACADEDGVYYVDEDGTATYTEEEAIIPATGHNMTHYKAIPATCEEDGSVEYYTCSEEEGVYYVDEEGTATYTEDELVVPAIDHSYTIEVDVTTLGDYTAPTCTEDGYVAYQCDMCGKVEITSVSATGHSYVSEITTEPTCTESGVMTYTCENCEYSYDVVIQANGHNMTKVDAVAATCTESGTVEYYTCSEEEGVYYADEDGTATYTEDELITEATGHTLRSTSTQGTYYEDGEETSGRLYYSICTACQEEWWYVDSSKEEEVEVIKVTSEEELSEAIETVTSDADNSYVIVIESDLEIENEIDISEVTVFVSSNVTFTNGTVSE